MLVNWWWGWMGDDFFHLGIAGLHLAIAAAAAAVHD